MKTNPVYKRIFWLTPKKYREWVKNMLAYAGFGVTPESYIGFSILYGFVLGLSVWFFSFLSELSPVTCLAIGFFGFFIFEIVIHSLLVLLVDTRVKFVEEVLPDALSLISSNIRSGLTVDKALLFSARPEFGPLGEEIKNASKMVMLGESMEEAIREIAKDIKSKVLKRTVDLLIEGIKQGGEIANLLDGLAEDIRQAKVLKREVSAYVLMYVIFIFFATGIGAPVLFSISSYLVQTMTEMGKLVEVMPGPSTGNIPMVTFKAVSLGEDFLMLYSLISLGLTSIFGGLLIGIVQEGSETGGIKFIPILLVISIGVFLLSKIVIGNVFGAMIV